MDLKATSLVSKAVLTNVAELNNNNDDTSLLTLRDQVSRASMNYEFLDQDDNEFIEGALDDIMNDMDDGDGSRSSRSSTGSNNGIGATPKLLRTLSTLSGHGGKDKTSKPRGRRASRR